MHIDIYIDFLSKISVTGSKQNVPKRSLIIKLLWRLCVGSQAGVGSDYLLTMVREFLMMSSPSASHMATAADRSETQDANSATVSQHYTKR